MVGTIAYFLAALAFLYRGLRYHFPVAASSWAIILIVLAEGIPLYVFRRPVFSHIPFLFLNSVLLFLFLKAVADGGTAFQRRMMFMIGALCGLMILVRNNNVFLALLWPVVIEMAFVREALRSRIKRLGIALLGLCIPVLFFKGLSGGLFHWQAGADRLMEIYSAGFYIHRFWHVLFGIDRGLIFTAPFLLIVPFTAWLQRFFADKDPWPRWPIFLVAMLPTMSMLVFEGTGTKLTLEYAPQYFGEAGWGNNIYQLQVWSSVSLDPLNTLVIIFKGGAMYLLVLLSEFLHVTENVPVFLRTKYSSFSPEILIRVIIIYALPVIAYVIYRKLCRFKD